MGQIWRFIPRVVAPGTLQMAIDHWLLSQYQAGLQPPTLRFYTWSPPAISLGYHQRQWPRHWRSLWYQGQPIELVRRPSGGRAVLHNGDLTYALVTHPESGKRMQTYQSLCRFLITGWQSLGFPLAYGSAQRGYHLQTNCFHLSTSADLVLDNGAKLIGSAQVYRQGAVLQHGSMQLAPDPALWEIVFGALASKPLHHSRVEQLQQLNLDDITLALIQAAQTCFDMELQPQPLSPTEWELITQMSVPL